MKSVRFVAVIAFFSMLALSSCKRYYTCKCTITEAGVSKVDTFERPLRAHSKNDANETCATYQAQYNHSTPGSTICNVN